MLLYANIVFKTVFDVTNHVARLTEVPDQVAYTNTFYLHEKRQTTKLCNTKLVSSQQENYVTTAGLNEAAFTFVF